MQASKPTETRKEEAPEAPPSRCPRCASLVSGGYKFCPACAFRLRVERSEEAAPAPPRSPWKGGFLAVSAVAAVLALALVGVLLYHPTWLDLSRAQDAPGSAVATSRALATPAFRVEEIPSLLVPLAPGGFAQSYTFSELPLLNLTDAEHEAFAAQLGSSGLIDAKIWYELRVMKFEVTCGQYEEFIQDLEAHRDRIPDVWIADDRLVHPEVAAVDLFDHIPTPWQAQDALGERTWHLEELARNLPVTHVSYVDALGFAEWASDRLGMELTLPYAVEWMRAARAGNPKNLWPWGEIRFPYACNNLAYWGGPGHVLFVHWPYSEPADAKIGGATPDGLYAMAGNVSEWTVSHDFEVVPTLPGTSPYLAWIEKKTPSPWFYAFGGSFHSAIDDCQVDQSKPYGGRDRSRDDVGFRLVWRPR